jgi:hypothetical protein
MEMKYCTDSVCRGAAFAGGDNGVGGGVVTEVELTVVLVMCSERETRTFAQVGFSSMNAGMVAVTFVPSTTAVSSPASTVVVWLGMVDVKGDVGVVGVLPDKLAVKRGVGVLSDRVEAKGRGGVVGLLSDRVEVKRKEGLEDV